MFAFNLSHLLDLVISLLLIFIIDILKHPTFVSVKSYTVTTITIILKTEILVQFDTMLRIQIGVQFSTQVQSVFITIRNLNSILSIKLWWKQGIFIVTGYLVSSSSFKLWCKQDVSITIRYLVSNWNLKFIFFKKIII